MLGLRAGKGSDRSQRCPRLAMAPREDPFLALSTALSVAVAMGVLSLRLQPLFPGSMLDSGIATPHSLKPRDETSPSGSAGWTDAEVWRAREECMHVLQAISADVEFLPPVKKDQCGAPAPVLLKGLGSNPTLVFDPPVETNCRLMATLHVWNKSTLQPKARETLKSPVSRILGASSYVCRNVYGLATGNLSQHAFANAIDIGAFELSDGRVLTGAQGWGLTRRDLLQASRKDPTQITAKRADLTARERLANITHSNKIPVAADAAAASFAKTNPTPAAAVALPTARPAMLFLRSVHKGGCSAFATVLGPEANETHRDHFHFDLNPTRANVHCN
jgi:hypothetical protein